MLRDSVISHNMIAGYKDHSDLASLSRWSRGVNKKMCKGLTKSPPILQPLSQKTSRCWAPPPMTCLQEWCSLREYRADRESRVVNTAPQSQPLCHGRRSDIRNFNLFVAVGARQTCSCRLACQRRAAASSLARPSRLHGRSHKRCAHAKQCLL